METLCLVNYHFHTRCTPDTLVPSHACVRACVHAYVRACVRVCVCACVRVCVFVLQPLARWSAHSIDVSHHLETWVIMLTLHIALKWVIMLTLHIALKWVIMLVLHISFLGQYVTHGDSFID